MKIVIYLNTFQSIHQNMALKNDTIRTLISDILP